MNNVIVYKTMIFTRANYFFFLIGILTTTISASSQPATFDVVVYGGTAGGFASAIQVARMGKSVALLEPGRHIGGMSVEGLGGTDIDNHPEFQNSLAVGGLALEFYRRIAKAYNRDKAFDSAIILKRKLPELWRFESSVAEKVIREWLAEYRVNCYYQSRLSEAKNAVSKQAGAITSIKMDNGRVYKGKIFIDATIEGDLLAAAGITTVIGREANALYNETLNGIRAETDHGQFAVKVDPYKTPGVPSSGVLPTIQDEPFGIPGEGDKSLQAYCYRLCLTKNKANQVVFTAPAGYDRSEYEIYIRYEKAGGKLYKPSARLPNGKTDFNGGADLSHNLYGMNRDYPGGNYAVREKVLSYHKNFTRGLFYFLATDTAVSAATRNEWSQWGLCKDEFTDNDNWPRMFYVRDARRMVSEHVITQHHGSSVNPVPVNDPVAVAYWPMDVHSARRVIKDGYAYNEGFVFGGNYWRPFGVSYQAMVPKKRECNNLLTPTCISASHIAYGAVRLEYNYMTQGQACAIAAVLAIKTKTPVQSISYEMLRSELLKAGAIIDASRVGVPTNK